MAQPWDQYSSPPRRQYFPSTTPETSKIQLPSLPSMSTLLASSEPPQPHTLEPDQRTFTYPQRPFPSHLSHPLHFSEANPSAPLHHLYQPPQPTRANHQPSPVLIPAAQNNLSLSPMQYEPPTAQQRQSKTIGKRREFFPKEGEYLTTNHSHLESRAEEPPHPRHYPYGQDVAQSSPQSSVSSSLISPRDTSQSKSIPISNLLSERASSQPDLPPIRYGLIVLQQPESARACGFGERDRRVVDPPPILVLDIDEPHDRPETYVVHCTLWNPDMDEDDSAMPVSAEKRQQKRLMGNYVASPFYGKDEQNVKKCFFTFPDLSVRTPGTYSLQFLLVALDLRKMGVKGYQAPVVATVNSNAFQVFNAKDFRGMRASTALTKSLKAQGCLIPVKKGNSRAKTTGDDDDEDGNEMDMDDDEAEEEETNRGKRAKR